MWTIRPLSVGELEVDQSNLTPFEGAGTPVRVVCYIWVVSNGDEVIVVDAGPPDPATVLERKGRVLYRTASQEPRATLEAAGVDLERVREVVISHLHWDHAANLGLFPNARLLVQRKELQYAIAPWPLHAAPYECLDGRLQPLWLKGLPRMVALDGPYEPREGLSIHPLPGHTPGSQGLRVATSRGAYMIASDAIPSFVNWERRMPSKTYTDLTSYYQTFAKLERLADVVLPGHDPRVQERVCYP
jgi:glyoxylase-like metal-dependent hydrolase (beta-lactamase superfamily II)